MGMLPLRNSWRERTHLVELFYSTDQVRVAGGVLKVHVIWKKNRDKQLHS